MSKRLPARRDSPRSTRSRISCTRQSRAARWRRGVIESIETAPGKQAPGVIAVVTHLNAPQMKVPAPLSFLTTGDGGTTVKILNTMRHLERPADRGGRRRDGRAGGIRRVAGARHYTKEQAVTAFEAAIAQAKTPKDVLGESPEIVHRRSGCGVAVAAHAVDLTFTTPPYNHNAIEPHAAIAVWTGDDRVTVYDTSQFTAGGASSLAHVFGLKSENVTLLAPFVGGGFGGKGTLWFYNQLCVMAARVTGRPVRIALTREGVFRLVGGRTPSRQRVAIAADETGKFTAFIHEGVTAQSNENSFPEQFSFPPRHLYAMESYRIGQRVTTVHRIANTFMRAPGESIGTFTVESAIDALAYELKMDPIELRARNEPDADPVSGHAVFQPPHARGVRELAPNDSAGAIAAWRRGRSATATG